MPPFLMVSPQLVEEIAGGNLVAADWPTLRARNRRGLPNDKYPVADHDTTDSS
jgi:hypothetical protein